MKNKTNSKGFIQIIVILLALVLVAGGAYYFGTLKNKVALVPTPSPVASAQPTPSPVATADPTSNWKTYTNKTYGISFNYPKEAKIMGDIESQLFTIVSESQSVSFLASKNSQDYSVNEFMLRTISPDNPDSIRKYVTFSNLSFNNLSFVLANQDANYFSQQSGSLNSYLIGKGNYVFSFGFNKVSEPLGAQILSTFKFLEPVANSSCIKDSDCGLDICNCKADIDINIPPAMKACARVCEGKPVCVNSKCVLIK